MFLILKTDLPLCPELLDRGTKSSCYLSETRRIVEVGRDLLRPSSPTLMLKQGQLEQVAHDCIQLGFEYLHGWRLHRLLLSKVLVPVSGESRQENPSKTASKTHKPLVPWQLEAKDFCLRQGKCLLLYISACL